MKKTFVKNLLRDIKGTFSRFLSIMIIIAIGVAFYAGVRATSPSMKKSADLYFSKNNFMDFKVLSNSGFNKTDIAEIKDIKGVKKVQGAYSMDALIEQNKRSLVLNVLSLPKEDGINKIRMVRGRIAENDNEIVVEENFFKHNHLNLNDKIVLQSGNDSNIKDKLKNNEFKIVGTAKSPLFVSMQRQLSSVGNGTVKGFVYILPRVFKIPVYTEAYVKIEGSLSQNSMMNYEEYKKESYILKKKIKKSDWYVLERTDNIGYETYRQDSERIDNIGKAFPMIFFLVAALVSLTTMTRMVQEKRIEIGTFKALGYSRFAIVAHYLIYSLSASLIGSIVGILLGFRLFPQLIIKAYSSLYAIPDSVTPFIKNLAVEATIIAVVFTTVASIAATLEELRETPASLMRPKAPKTGKSILFEKITFIWKRLSFTKKVTVRNIFRYKIRFFMTVIGIAACTGLMVTGFGLKGAILGATDNQFNNIYKYDIQGTFIKGIDNTQKSAIEQNILKEKNIKSIVFTYLKNSFVKNNSSENQDSYVIVPENCDEFSKYINLTANNKKLKFTNEGIIITEKLSKLLHKKIGDSIEISINDKIIKAKIADITEQYIQHFIYISPIYFEKLTAQNVVYNNFYGLLKNTNESMEDHTLKTMTSIKNIGSVSFKNRIQTDYDKNMGSVNSVILVLIVSAGALAFVVIYNLTNININERRSELATVKLLGFYDSEVALYIYRENIISTVVGSIVGIGLGILMNRYVIISAETNILMFYKKINPVYFVYSVLLTLVFSLIVNLAMYKRFGKIDMIESLKNVE